MSCVTFTTFLRWALIEPVVARTLREVDADGLPARRPVR
jgi:hypothetical protein